MDTDRLAEVHFASVDPQFYDDTDDLKQEMIEEASGNLETGLYSMLEEIVEKVMDNADPEVIEDFMKNESHQDILRDLEMKFEEYR